MLRRIELKKAGILNISMSLFTVVVHLLVIFRIMPYTWINGGRSATYEIGRQTSINSIPYFIIGILIILIASEIIRIRWNKVTKIIFSILLWGLVVWTCLGLIMQILGTAFEKSVMSIVCAISIITGIRLAIEKH